MDADPTTDTVNMSPFRYDGCRTPRPVEPAGMAPCYPAFTYDPGPQPQTCDKPLVVDPTPANDE